MNTVIVACRTISDELNKAIKETNNSYPVLWIDSGLHMNPGSLREVLQRELDHITNVDRVLLAFGYCGNALLGLTSPSCAITFPRVDDCITMLLGSKKRRSEVMDEMGTYFLTKGWLVFEKNIWVEYQETIKKYGIKKADMIFKKMLEHYKRLAVIDTGAFEMNGFLEKTKNIAEDLKLQHYVIPGTVDYLKKLLTGPWDEDFITVKPGETITLEHIYNV